MQHRSIGILLFALASFGASGCRPSPTTELVEASIVHLQAAAQMLREAHGDERKLLEAALTYRAQHGREIGALRLRGEALQATMDDQERRQLESEMRDRATPLIAQIDLASQQYPKPQEALRYIRPLMVQPRPRGAMPRTWLPEAPPLPAEFADPATPTGKP